jgi:hypothetical protein
MAAYGTLAGFRAYALARGDNAPTAASDALAEAALMRASDMIRLRYVPNLLPGYGVATSRPLAPICRWSRKPPISRHRSRWPLPGSSPRRSPPRNKRFSLPSTVSSGLWWATLAAFIPPCPDLRSSTPCSGPTSPMLMPTASSSSLSAQVHADGRRLCRHRTRGCGRLC